MSKLFGTDGIRGEVGKYPLTQEAIFILGKAIGNWLKEQYPQQKSPFKIVIGKDTRESGDKLEEALASGAHIEGLEVLCLGVAPTPGIAYLTCALDAHLGLAISASHNPGSDNGIKFFNADGYKLFSASERRIEELFSEHFSKKTCFQSKYLKKKEEIDYIRLYSDFVKGSLNGFDLSNLTVVIDCAFGSFSKVAPKVFQELGAKVFAINTEADGKNINVDCGTLHPQMMSKKILEHRADIGIAFDGDGDRLIVADAEGNVLDGDYILAILGQDFLNEKRLPNNTVICTQMSNVGLELYLRRRGIAMIRTEVGDKYVLQEMLKRKAGLGGEQSGHIIILEHATTGDGLIAALELIKVMLKSKKTLRELTPSLQKFPQVLLNVKVREKKPLERISGLTAAIKRGQAELGQDARILVRYSGTEKLARIMVEGSEAGSVNGVANRLSQIIKEEVGES